MGKEKKTGRDPFVVKGTFVMRQTSVEREKVGRGVFRGAKSLNKSVTLLQGKGVRAGGKRRGPVPLEGK